MSREILNYNTKFLSDLVQIHDRDSKHTHRMNNLLGGLDKEQIYNLLSLISTTNSSKFMKIAGSGTVGLVFEMDNGNMLKFFRSRYTDDLEWYEDIKRKRDSGTDSTAEPYIYDFGDIGEFKWVEMGKLVPFEDYFEHSGRDSAAIADILVYFTSIVEDYYENKEGTLENEEYKERYARNLESLKEESKRYNVTMAEISEIFHMAFEMAKIHGVEQAFGDFHMGNIGIIHSTAKTDQPKFVLFDK